MSSAKKKYLEKGLTKLYKAAEADDSDRLSEALQLYIKGTGHLYNSLQYDDHSPEEKKSLHANYLQYLARIDKIEQILEEEKRRKKEEKKGKKKEKKGLFKFQQGSRSFDREEPSYSTPQVQRKVNSPARNINKPVSASVPGTPIQRHVNRVPSLDRTLPTPSPPEEDFPPLPEDLPLKGSIPQQRRSPPPVPNTPRPMFYETSTLGRRRPPLAPLHTSKPTAEALRLPQVDKPLSPSSYLPTVNSDYEFPRFIQRRKEIQCGSSSQLKTMSLLRNTSPRTRSSDKSAQVQVHREPEVHSTGTLLRIHDKYMKNTNINNNNNYNSRNKATSNRQFSDLDADTLIANAMTIILMATKEDLKGNYKGAMQKYEDAVKLIHYILQEYQSISRETRESIRSKGVLYQDRLDTIRAMISKISPCQQKSRDEVDEIKVEEEYRQVITTHKPNILLSSVAGQDDAKDTLTNIILSPIRFPNMFKENSGRNARSVLLYGPPGSGKTYLAKAVACEARNASYFYAKASDLISKHSHDAIRLIQMLFGKAREYRPSIVIIDDLEYLQHTCDQNDVSRDKKQELATQIQSPKNDGVFIISVTNAPWNLDSVFRNSFNRTIGLTLPDLPARINILNMQLKQITHSLNEKELVQLAHQTERFSGADLSSLIHDALMQPVFRLQAATHFKKVRSQSHMDGVFVPCNPNDVDALPMTLADLDEKDLQDPCLSYDDVKIALASARSSVTSADLLKFEEYRRNNKW